MLRQSVVVLVAPQAAQVLQALVAVSVTARWCVVLSTRSEAVHPRLRLPHRCSNKVPHRNSYNACVASMPGKSIKQVQLQWLTMV